MEDEEFNFDDFMEDSNRDFEIKLEEYRDKMMSIAIEDNFSNISKNGINEWHLRHMNSDELISLKVTFNMMVSYFEEREDCEKCALVHKYHEIIDTIILQKSDI
mgnify:FL=1